MENLPEYNYFNFDLLPPFTKNTKYYIPFLNITSKDNVGHWTGIYCSLNKGIIYYYDSLNKDIKPIYKKLIEKISNKMEKIRKSLKMNEKVIIKRNNKQTQYYNAYCGVYQMYFLACCLNFDKATDDKNIYLNKLNEHVNEDLNEELIEQYITKMFFNSPN